MIILWLFIFVIFYFLPLCDLFLLLNESSRAGYLRGFGPPFTFSVLGSPFLCAMAWSFTFSFVLGKLAFAALFLDLMGMILQRADKPAVATRVSGTALKGSANPHWNPCWGKFVPHSLLPIPSVFSFYCRSAKSPQLKCTLAQSCFPALAPSTFSVA